jgi:hypothetical protein
MRARRSKRGRSRRARYALTAVAALGVLRWLNAPLTDGRTHEELTPRRRRYRYWLRAALDEPAHLRWRAWWFRQEWATWGYPC